MMSFGAHLVLEADPAFLIFDRLTRGATSVNVFQKLDYFWDGDMLTHSAHEVLDTDHVESGEAFEILTFFAPDISVFYLFRHIFKDCLLHSVQGLNRAEP